jgi:hypothetical protein
MMHGSCACFSDAVLCINNYYFVVVAETTTYYWLVDEVVVTTSKMAVEVKIKNSDDNCSDKVTEYKQSSDNRTS